LSGTRFEIVFATRPCEIACGDVSARAQGLLVQRGRDGQVEYMAGLNGQQLSLKGASLAACDDPRPLLEVEIKR
jgi:hypothetical protein